MKKFLLCCAAFIAFALNAQTYSRVYASYSNFDAIVSAHGANVGYLYGYNLPLSLPLSVEAGIEAQFHRFSLGDAWDDVVDDTAENMLALSIPLSVAYKIELKEGISLIPFTGPNLRFNVYDSQTSKDEELKEDLNLFQFGWNAGIGVQVKNIYFGYRFTGNFNEYVKDWVDNGTIHAITVGYQF